MKTTTQVLDQADEKECELTLLTEEIADMLLRPASSRDSRRLAHLWEDVARMRSGMRVIGGSLRKIEKPVRGRMAAAEYRARRNRYDRARTFQRRLRQWDEIERLVQRHVEPERTPLLGRPLPTRKDALLTQIYEAFHRLANSVSQDQQALDHGCFADIALPIQPFDRLMSGLVWRKTHAARCDFWMSVAVAEPRSSRQHGFSLSRTGLNLTPAMPTRRAGRCT